MQPPCGDFKIHPQVFWDSSLPEWVGLVLSLPLLTVRLLTDWRHGGFPHLSLPLSRIPPSRESQCHAVRMLKQPCGSILPQSCELVVLEEDPSASVRFHVSIALPGNYNPVRHQSHSDKLLPGFLPSEAGERICVCCFMLQNLGAFCYTATGNYS